MWYSSIFNGDLNVVIYAINIMIALAIIFLERKNPSSTLAWVLVLFFLPIVGLLLYLVFSQNISRQRIYRLTDSENAIISGSLHEQIKAMDENRFIYENETSAQWSHMIKLNQIYGNAFLTQNNSVELYTDGREMFHALLRDIRNAKYSINVMSFIIKDDMVGRKLLDALAKKAEEGVEVRLLVDALGSRSINGRKLRAFERAGGKVAYFFKPKLKYLTLRFNYRNHRKIVVIDEEIGYTGGFNIANEYLSFKKKFGYWRDTHLRIVGGAVQDLNAVFILDWRFTSKENLELKELYYTPVSQQGNSAIQIVMSGPNSERVEIKRGMMRMITYASKSIYLQTPYFVPDSSMLESLKMAAQSGVDVKIMIPKMPDHMFVYWATLSYCGELIKSGAKVYIYNNGFLHAKTLVVDGEVATVGSANFDRRSFRLNFEANAFVYDKDFALKMEDEFHKDMELSKELTLRKYNRRKTIIKIKEAISRLLSDIL